MRRVRRAAGLACGVAAVVLGIGPSAVSNPSSGVKGLSVPSPFVVASGPRLYLNGMPWYFTGYDAFQLPSVQVGTRFSCGGPQTPSWLDQMLGEIQASSGSPVVRTWFFQSYSGANFAQFDAVLSAAAAHHVKVVPVLVNQWAECEPWAGGGPGYRNLAWYEGGYTQPGDGYALSFRDYALKMAAHYANNQTIAFWQLVNEAEAMDGAGGPCEEGRAASALRRFADDVSGAMRSVDANHLISLGTIGTGQCGIAGSDYAYVHSGNIDLCEYHDYVPGAVNGDQWNGMIQDVKTCAGLGKPIFAGEVGIDASVRPDWSQAGAVSAATLAQRAAFFQDKMAGQFGLGISGFLVWMKTSTPSSGFDVGPSDPTELALAAEQSHLDLLANSLPDGHFITDGEPLPQTAPPPAALVPVTPAAGGQTAAPTMPPIGALPDASSSPWRRLR
jgi:mannan endo-1,4-beta-mannosidase